MDNRPTAFVAGPYFSTGQNGKADHVQIHKNIREAERVAVWLWDNEYEAFCPHKNTSMFHVLTSQKEDVYRAFAQKVLRSGLIELLVLAKNYEKSKGTKEEIELCQSLGIPVYAFRETFISLLDVHEVLWRLSCPQDLSKIG